MALFHIMSRAPFAKRPASRATRQEFYWRGGDSLHEREYLRNEYKKAMVDFKKAQMEYKSVEQELKKANEQLSEKEKYTNALASYLDSDAEGGNQEQEYKRQLGELEVEIGKAESELSDARAVQHPAVSSGLQKDKAYMMIEIQRLKKALDLRDEQEAEDKKQLATCVVSQKYQNALQMEGIVEKLSRKRAFLRSQVNKNKQEFDKLTSQAPAQSRNAQPVNKEDKQCVVDVAELELINNRIAERQQRRPNKWNMEISRQLRYIEELNERMRDLGMESDVVDVEALREKYMIKQKQEGENGNENGENDNGNENNQDNNEEKTQ